MKTLTKFSLMFALLFSTTFTFAAVSAPTMLTPNSDAVVTTSHSKPAVQLTGIKAVSTLQKAYSFCLKCDYYAMLGVVICVSIPCPEK